MVDRLRETIENVLRDVHIETGRTDEWEHVVSDLERAIRQWHMTQAEKGA